MASNFYNEVTALLGQHGFSYWKPAKGGHQKWRNSAGKVLIVPSKIKSRHTANGILKDAGAGKQL